MRKLIIGIDVGGTKVAGGLITDQGRLVATAVVPTRAGEGFKVSYGQILQLIESLIQQARGKHYIRGIGICAPGPVDAKAGVVLTAPNMRGWRDVKLGQKIAAHFGLPAKVENDANAAGLAEVLFGAAAGMRDVFYVTVSTGIGTGIIIDQKVYHGAHGVAGEGGHVSIDFHSPFRCGCGTYGCIEALAAGPGMARRARVRLEQDYKAKSLLREMCHGHTSRITPKMIQDAARARDPIAQSIIDETGFLLGVWLAGMMTVLDPEAIVIGGGVAQIGRPLFRKIKETIPYYTINRRFASQTPVLPAKLQKQVGVFGAASLFLPSGEELESGS